jgi:hypothetical protein
MSRCIEFWALMAYRPHPAGKDYSKKTVLAVRRRQASENFRLIPEVIALDPDS